VIYTALPGSDSFTDPASFIAHPNSSLAAAMTGSLKNKGARHASIEGHKCVLLSAGAVVGRRRPVRGRLRVQNFRVGLSGVEAFE
jgi:hypothetical protein